MTYMNLINRLLIILIGVLSFSVHSATKDQVTIEAYNAIYANALTSVKGECLSFDVDSSNDGFYLITVRENHANPGCGGDNEVSAKMFDLRIDKSTGSVYTNQGNEPDNFRQLRGNNDRCSVINDDAERKQSKILSSESGYVVADTQRVYFYSAPDEACKIKGLFVINGDQVNLYAEYKDFSSVVFFKKDGEPVSGWIHSESVKPTGTGVGPESK